MQVKSGIKIGILFLFIILILIGGFIMFQRLNHNKQVFETDVHVLIPADISVVIQINKQKESEKFRPYLNELNPIFKSIESTLSYPLYILKSEDNTSIMAKLTSQQEIILRNKLEDNIFSLFSPKERMYKNVKILLYATTDDSFFCCMFYKGLFVGGYNYKLLENVIDTDVDNNFFAKPEIKKIAEKVKTLYSGNLYLKDSIHFSAFNITFSEDGTRLEGYSDTDTHQLSDCDKNEEEDKGFNPDSTIFPNSAVAYEISMNREIISDSIACLFALPTYKFYLEGMLDYPIHALKHNSDKFILYNLLNDLELSLTHRRLNTHDFAFGNQRIYTSSTQLAKNIFKSNDLIFFTFYKEYLFFTSNRLTLISYLKNNGKYSQLYDLENFDHNDIDLQSTFYSSMPMEIIPFYFNLKKYGLINTTTKSIYMNKYIDNQAQKIDFYLIN